MDHFALRWLECSRRDSAGNMVNATVLQYRTTDDGGSEAWVDVPTYELALNGSGKVVAVQKLTSRAP